MLGELPANLVDELALVTTFYDVATESAPGRCDDADCFEFFDGQAEALIVKVNDLADFQPKGSPMISKVIRVPGDDLYVLGKYFKTNGGWIKDDPGPFDYGELVEIAEKEIGEKHIYYSNLYDCWIIAYDWFMLWPPVDDDDVDTLAEYWNRYNGYYGKDFYARMKADGFVTKEDRYSKNFASMIEEDRW